MMRLSGREADSMGGGMREQTNQIGIMKKR